MWIPAQGIHVLWQQYRDYRNPVEKRDGVATLQVRERVPNPAWTGFYCFSRYLTRRMVLIYYAQVPFRRLQKTKERVLLITSKRKDIYKCKEKSG